MRADPPDIEAIDAIIAKYDGEAAGGGSGGGGAKGGAKGGARGGRAPAVRTPTYLPAHGCTVLSHGC
jgi:hypothetical protein